MKIEKNGLFEGEVSGYGTEGEGIIKIEGTTAFVPFCVAGERVLSRALKVKDNIVYGRIEEVISSSPDRVAAPCPVFTKCGGCALQHVSYAAQLKFKREQVLSALSKIGGIYVGVNDTIPCKSEYRYRNKLALPIGQSAEGGVEIGFYAPRSHRIVPVDDCLIQSEWVREIIAAVRSFAHITGYTGYDEVKRRGDLRQIAVREIKGKFIIAVVATRRISLDELKKLLDMRFKNYTLLLNINNSTSNVIFSKEWHICRGEGVFEAEECGIKYSAGANTFVQVNDDVREKLYSRVLEEVKGFDVALDLYSGGGLLTAMLARACGRVYGVEVVEEASRCADELKAANGLDGKMFNLCGRVEDEIDGVLESTEGRRRVVVCDPPRKGMERSVVKKIAKSSAERIVLISCNPATLARDLGLLTGTLVEDEAGALKKADHPKGGYEILSVTPFDMFPQTKHVETLVVLSKKIPDSHINIEVEFGEGEGQLSLKKIRERAEARKPKEK